MIQYKEKIYVTEMKGIVEETGGRKTGMASILTPKVKSDTIKKTLNRLRAKYREIEVWLSAA